MYTPHIVGKNGEELVSRYYISKGFQLLEHNWRCNFGEIDLIFLKEKILYFIEVKTRRSKVFGYPEEAVSSTKAQRLRRCAGEYCYQKRRNIKKVCIQVCAVLFSEKNIRIKIFKV